MSRFEKIIGDGAVKEELSMALGAMHDPEKYKKLGVKLPSGILLGWKINSGGGICSFTRLK